MINIIMAVYKGLDLISTPLESLLIQEDKNFILTIVQDYDELDYTDIIQKYRGLGLIIDHVKASEHIKQGRARQLGIDSHPECDYIMFLDQDDELFPNAVKELSSAANEDKCDVVCANFIKEKKIGSEIVNLQHKEIITQHHGKLYSTKYLKQYDIRFSPKMNYSEDSYFNTMCFYCSKNIVYIDVVVYRWIYNPNSESHFQQPEYFKKMSVDFIYGQCQALIHIYKYNPEINPQFVADTILGLYWIDMISRIKQFPDRSYLNSLQQLGQQQFIQEFVYQYATLKYFATHVSGGTLLGNEPIFFNYSFLDWLKEWVPR